MLTAISYKEATKSSDLFYGQFQLRHREFVDRQGYAVRSIDSMEFDQFDTLASVYLVYSEDGRNVLGCSRLTPISYGCMLAELFPQLVDDQSIFARPKVWEGTRFCIDRRLPAEQRRNICRHISLGYIEYGLANGVDHIIGLMPTIILRTVFERNGIRLGRLGAVQKIGDHSKIQAASIAIGPEQLAAAESRTGLSNVLGLRPEFKRHAG